MRVLFLDIDGVLNSFGWDDLSVEYAFEGIAHLPIRLRRGAVHLDHRAIKHLNTILERTDAQVVVSSAWRREYTLDQIGRMLAARGFRYAERLLDTTDCMDWRGQEIDDWLAAHPEVDTYLVLDDLPPSEIEPHDHRLLQTTESSGLRDYHIDLAVCMLRDGCDATEAMRLEGWLEE